MRSLATLYFVCVIDVLGFGIMVPLVPYMANRFGTPPELLTPLLGVYSLCQLIATPLWGRLSDRYGRRPILISSMAGACASYLMMGFASNIWWLLAARVLGGFSDGSGHRRHAGR
jgi:MFS family permease